MDGSFCKRNGPVGTRAKEHYCISKIFRAEPLDVLLLSSEMDLSIWANAAVKALADLAKDGVTRWLDRRRGNIPPSEISTDIESHLAEVNAWSARIQFYGMSSAHSTQDTVPLDLEIPRSFRGVKKSARSYSERDLLTDSTHILILGGPGSGKTTTLKRLSRLLLDEPARAGEFEHQIPIVIRLRELEGSSIYDELVNVLGVRSAVNVREVQNESEEEDAAPICVKEIGGMPYASAVHELLNATSALVLIDGVDEVLPQWRGQLYSELEQLARGLSTCKLIVTWRSGDYERHLDGFDVHELCPLKQEQITLVAVRWLSQEAEAFLQALRAVPYRDMAERPLLLAQLLKLFEDDGVLPLQPTEVYERMVGLLLERWDKERGIARGSRYAGFTSDRKAKFLAALSYHLTIRVRKKVFSERLLIEAYSQICDQFGLPQNEAQMVARELESHTGIIVQGSRSEFEFSHLSIQEYLCAEYIVRDSFPDRLSAYLQSYPEPVAVAVAISSNPSNWLASLLLRKSAMINFTIPSLRTFIQRLLVERPIFEHGVPLGLVLLKLFWLFDEEEEAQPIYEFARMANVQRSLADALQRCYRATCFAGQRFGFGGLLHSRTPRAIRPRRMPLFLGAIWRHS